MVSLSSCLEKTLYSIQVCLAAHISVVCRRDCHGLAEFLLYRFSCIVCWSVLLTMSLS